MKIVCDCCKMSAFSLSVAESKVMPDVRLIMCVNCIEKGFEPRWSIVMASAAHGLTDCIKELINNKLYIGPPINAIEVL